MSKDLLEIKKKLAELESNSHPPVDWDGIISKILFRLNEIELSLEDLHEKMQSMQKR